MRSLVRALARRVSGVRRIPTYYLPWLTRPGLECVLLLSNVEARFKSGHNAGPFALSVIQHDADGAVVEHHDVTLADSEDTRELRLRPTAAGYGLVTVSGEGMYSDLYVTLGGDGYAASHGRGEFVERYPFRARLALSSVGGLLSLLGRTLPAFVRHQYLYAGAGGRSHLLLLNLANVTNRLRVTFTAPDRRSGPARLIAVPPMGARFVDTAALGEAPGGGISVWRARIEGHSWFNLYLVGAGARGLAGPLSLMHVK